MVNQNISHYKIIKELGRGGMGEVYLAEDSKLERKVALKFLPTHYTTNPDVNARFQREAKAAAALNHPNIITVYEIGEHEGRAYIAMEYIDGQSLRDVITKSQLPIKRIIGILSQICEGLAKAHQAGIVHRDLKPENIMLDADGTVKILDFGLAQMKGKTKLTSERSTMGTLYYMSPEQLEGANVDHRADIWAVGVMLYEMVTGKLPFEGEYEQAVIYSIVNEEPEPLARYKTGVSPDLQRIVDKALDKDRETRYQGISDLLADLKRERKSSAISKKSIRSVRSHKLKRAVLRYAAMAAVVVIAVVAGMFILKPPPAPKIQATHKQVTFTGKAFAPAMSSDGQFIAYLTGSINSAKDIMVQDLTGGQPLEVFTNADAEFISPPAWSPSGAELMSHVAFRESRATYIIPRLGGNTRTMKMVRPLACYSPDGTQIASISFDSKVIWFMNETTGEYAFIYLLGPFQWMRDLDWSPLGNRLVVLTNNHEKHTIHTMKIDGSQQQKVIEDRLVLFSPRWSGDGRAIYYVRSDGQTRNLMKVNIDVETGKSRGSPSTLLAGLPFGDYFQLSRDNKRLLYTREINSRNLWLVTLKEQADTIGIDTKQLTTGTSWMHDPAISPDGKRIAFSIGRRPRAELYVMPIIGGQMQQLTFMNSYNAGAAWSPDGKEIAFGSTQGGKSKVWRIGANGGTPRSFSKSELSEDSFSLTWTSGSGILYERPGNTNYHFLDPATENENPLVPTEFGFIFLPRFSPDEKKVAFHGNGFSGKESGLWLLSIGDGTPKFMQSGKIGPLKWSNDGDWIYAHTFGTEQPQIMKIPANGGQARSIVTLPRKIEFETLAMSPDEKQIVAPVTQNRSDVWLVENFDPENELQQPVEFDKTGLQQLTYLQKGESLLRKKAYAQAVSAFREGLALNDEHLTLTKRLAYSIQLQGKFEEAERLYRAAYSISPEDMAVQYQLGWSLFHQQEFEDALNFAEKALTQDSIFTNYNLIASILVSGNIDIERGLIFAEKALVSKPENWAHSADVYSYYAVPEHTIGLAYLKKDDYEKAVQYLEQAAAFLPERQAIRDDLQIAKEKLREMAGK